MPPEFSAASEAPASVADWTAEPSSRNSSIQRINGRIPDSTWLPVVRSIPAHTTGIRIQPPMRAFHPKGFVPRLSGGSAATVAEPDHPGTTWASACPATDRCGNDPAPCVVATPVSWVLRYLVWVETTSGGRSEVELSGDEIGDGSEVSNGAIAASLCLGGLYEAVDSLNETIGDLAMEPT